MSSKSASALKRASTLKEALEQDIVTGQLAPGTRLEEMGLATRFGVSRTPVREALNQLASIGLVQIRPRRGAVVAAIGLKEMMEMFEVMAELEGMCGQLAARRMIGEDRAKLAVYHEQARSFAQTEDHNGYYDANVCFHECIYLGSRNTYLADQTRALRNRLAPYRRLQLLQRQRLSGSFAEHGQILKAICDGDEARAKKLLSEHVTVQSGSFTDFIATLPTELIQSRA
ncbi:MAG: GntR family transcriptional regulator [Magnetovibrio sp.]|nr:GntR family transcriptional regulator [Magnetovibrio sp.]